MEVAISLVLIGQIYCCVVNDKPSSILVSNFYLYLLAAVAFVLAQLVIELISH